MHELEGLKLQISTVKIYLNLSRSSFPENSNKLTVKTAIHKNKCKIINFVEMDEKNKKRRTSVS